MATAAPVWNRWDILAAPAFATLAPLLEELPGDHFPTLAQLNRMCDEHEVVSGSGVAVEFVPQEAKTDEPYETRVYSRGKVLTRNNNWHDLFNALVWITFPRSKAAINRHHYKEMLAHQAEGKRGTPRDVLTLFDEGGLIVVSSVPELGALLREFRWKDLFWQRRDEVKAAMRFHAFGHSIYEKMLQPYKGITAKTVIFDVPPGEIFQRPGRARSDRCLCTAAGAGRSRLDRRQRRRALLRRRTALSAGTQAGRGVRRNTGQAGAAQWPERN
jgi:hypothetical protein